MQPSALFVGLCTLDIVQAVARMPGPNEKVTALRQSAAAGGPATNASVAFACLGGRATLLTGAGRHPLADGVRADLDRAGITLIDVAADDEAPPAVSSILVTEGSGDRSVVSVNAAGRELRPPSGLAALVDDARAVLIDGHHPALALAAARAARARGRLCILDGGSWKDNTADLLPYVDVAVCSADFRPPGAPGVPGAAAGVPGVPAGGVLDYLAGRGIGWAAVTDGARPVAWAGGGMRSAAAVPSVQVADTLGAGDIFHGAFTYSIAEQGAVDPDSFGAAIRFGARVAAFSCRYFGTRSWMREWAAHERAAHERE
jgi:sugar/nucleoside kinase (ribokinase family)